jgi:hypothetical protein
MSGWGRYLRRSGTYCFGLGPLAPCSSIGAYLLGNERARLYRVFEGIVEFPSKPYFGNTRAIWGVLKCVCHESTRAVDASFSPGVPLSCARPMIRFFERFAGVLFNLRYSAYTI